MYVKTAILLPWILALGACSASSSPSSGPAVTAAVDNPMAQTSPAIIIGGVTTAYETKVDTTAQLETRMNAYHGALQGFMHSCLFQDQATQAFTTALVQAVAGSNATCEQAVASLENQSILTQELNSKGLTEISLLAEFTFLTQLNISGNSIKDISPLAGLTKLTLLDISNNSVSDLTPVKGLVNLTELDILGNQIAVLDPLFPLVNLTILRMSSNNISDISCVRGMTGLVQLDVASNLVQNLNPLSNITSLQILYLGNNHIVSVSALSQLTQLTQLTLSQPDPGTVSSPANASTTTSTATTTASPAPLYKINDISPLAKLVHQQELTLRNNNVEDASIVSNMPAMVTLDLSNNNLSHVNFLTESSDESTCTCSLPVLKTLDLSGNQFTNLSMLQVCASSIKAAFTYSPQSATGQ